MDAGDSDRGYVGKRAKRAWGLIRLQDSAAAQRIELTVTGKGSSSGSE
jgi:hypothetical protein